VLPALAELVAGFVRDDQRHLDWQMTVQVAASRWHVDENFAFTEIDMTQ